MSDQITVEDQIDPPGHDVVGGKRTSRLTTDGISRAPNRAMLRAVGFHDDDFERPMIGVANLFSTITPCNSHLDKLATAWAARASGRAAACRRSSALPQPATAS